jgi:hypothetical protein
MGHSTGLRRRQKAPLCGQENKNEDSAAVAQAIAPKASNKFGLCRIDFSPIVHASLYRQLGAKHG